MRQVLRSLSPLVVLCASSWLAWGCASERSSPECKDVCREEARCMEREDKEEAGPNTGDENNKFDQSECIDTCTALQRDREGQRLVAQHVICVERSKDDCKALLACP